jgi:hypothetical protein
MILNSRHYRVETGHEGVGLPVQKTVSGQFFVVGNLIEYSGPTAPGSFVIPEGMEIVPWEHPLLFWLTLDGVRIAGPARRELLESIAHDLCTNPDRQEDLAALQEEVERLIVTRAKM